MVCFGQSLLGNPGGSIRAGSAGVKLMRRVASVTVMRRISPAFCENSLGSSMISTQSPVLKRSTSSRPRLSSSSSVAEIMLATREPTLAFSRDHLKVAVPPGWPGSWISIR
ncbi:hypothetical protein ACVWZ3_005886 [Bradyrhizobium sp. i1.3.6]